MNDWILNEPHVFYGKSGNELLTFIVDRTKLRKENFYETEPFYLFDLFVRQKKEKERNKTIEIALFRKELVEFYSKYKVDLSRFNFNREDLHDR